MTSPLFQIDPILCVELAIAAEKLGLGVENPAIIVRELLAQWRRSAETIVCVTAQKDRQIGGLTTEHDKLKEALRGAVERMDSEDEGGVYEALEYARELIFKK